MKGFLMHTKFRFLAGAVLLLLQTSCRSEVQPPKSPPQRVELTAAIFSYIPDGGFAIERLEHDFEAYAKAQGLDVDLDLDLLDPYAKPETGKPEKALDYDICEIERGESTAVEKTFLPMLPTVKRRVDLNVAC